MTTKRDASSDSDSDARREKKKRKKEKKERKKEKKERKRRKHEQQNTASDDETIERFRPRVGREYKSTASERNVLADSSAESAGFWPRRRVAAQDQLGMEQHDVEALVPRDREARFGQDHAARARNRARPPRRDRPRRSDARSATICCTAVATPALDATAPIFAFMLRCSSARDARGARTADARC